MTKTKQQTEHFEKCCAGFDPSTCCEQMSKMMQQFCGTEKDGFDCMAMMQKMGVGPSDDKEQTE